jgi:hypothetical protein
MRDHYVIIKLLNERLFMYEFSNSFEKGLHKGAYTLNDNLLTLESDSLISKKWTDILDEQKDNFKRVADSSKFEYIVTKEGLHEKIDGSNFKRESSFKKIK